MVDFDGLWTAAAIHLDALFKDGSHRVRKERLRDIYETTETWWERYVDLIPCRTVRYLMITEAPPWNTEYDSLQRVSTRLRTEPGTDYIAAAPPVLPHLLSRHSL